MGFGAEMEMRMYVTGEDEGDDALEEEHSPGGIVIESLLNIRTVASLTMEESKLREYNEALRAEDPTPMKTNFVKGSGFGLGQLFQMWGIALMFWFGAWLLHNNPDKYEFRDFIIAMFALFFSLYGLTLAFEGATDRRRAKLAADRIFDLTDRKSAIDPLSEEGSKGVSSIVKEFPMPKPNETLTSTDKKSPTHGSKKRLGAADDDVAASPDGSPSKTTSKKKITAKVHEKSRKAEHHKKYHSSRKQHTEDASKNESAAETDREPSKPHSSKKNKLAADTEDRPVHHSSKILAPTEETSSKSTSKKNLAVDANDKKHHSKKNLAAPFESPSKADFQEKIAADNKPAKTKNHHHSSKKLTSPAESPSQTESEKKAATDEPGKGHTKHKSHKKHAHSDKSQSKPKS
jgi:hypothetical protein